MSDRKNKVFILNSPEHFEHFHENLCATLEFLGCKTTVSTGSEEAAKILNGHISKYGILVLDPYVPNFEKLQLQDRIQSLPEDKRPAIVTIHFLPDLEVADTDRNLLATGNILKSYSPSEMAFVFNRLLFPAGENKRRHPRTLASVPVQICDSENGQSSTQETFNLSEGGTFIRSYTPASTMTDLRLTLHLPDGNHPLECHAQVVFSRPYSLGAIDVRPPGMGTEFSDVSEKEKSRLCRYISHQLVLTDPRFRDQDEPDKKE